MIDGSEMDAEIEESFSLYCIFRMIFKSGADGVVHAGVSRSEEDCCTSFNLLMDLISSAIRSR